MKEQYLPENKREREPAGLRGKLIERGENAGKAEDADQTEGTPDFPQLRGKLLNQIHERVRQDAEKLSRLRDSLIAEDEKEVELYSPDWLRARAFVQRDGGKSYVVNDIFESTHGGRIQLKSFEDQSTITLGLDGFIEKLQTAGSAWYVKEE